MPDLSEQEESPSGEAKQKPTGGRWNPFLTLRMIISPEERMALLSLPMPLLPAEDLMTKEQRKNAARARRRALIIRLIACVGVAVLAVLVWWLWPSNAPARETQREAVPLSAILPTASKPVAAPAVVTSTPTAEATSAPRPPTLAVSAPVASAHPAARAPKREPRATPPAKPVVAPAPANSSSPASHVPDFKTPW